LPFERNEITVTRLGLQRARLHCPSQVREIRLKQLSQQRRDTPAVEDRMMKTERELKLLLAAAMHLDAEERRTCPVETRLSFRRKPRRNDVLLLKV